MGDVIWMGFMQQVLKDGTVPTKTTKRPGEISDKEDFFKKDL